MVEKKLDIHTHLGDILYGTDIILREGVPDPSGYYEKMLQIREEHYLRDDYKYPDDPFVIEGLNREDYPGDTFFENDAHGVEAAFTARNMSATLEGWQRAMSRNGIEKAAVLPVLPQVGFSDIMKACKQDERVIPFTSIDFSLGDQAGNRLLEDVKMGAKGLKLHPVIQKVSLDEERLREALRHWIPTGLPVLSHIGVAEYYPEEERHRDTPINGAVEPFIRLVKDFPDITFIAGHSGNESWEILLEALIDRKNVFIDTSICSVSSLRMFYDEWGPERILYGSDWPWLRPEVPVAVIEKTISNADDREKIFWKNSAELLGIS